MKHKFLLLVFFSLCIGTTTFSQNWKEIRDSIDYYITHGEFNKGIIAGEKALVMAKKEFGELDSNYTNGLDRLGSIYYKIGQFDKAIDFYAQALEIRKKHSGENDHNYAQNLNNLANAYTNAGQFDKSEPLLLQSAAIRKKLFGEEHPQYAQCLNSLAGLYLYMGKYEKAEMLFIDALAIRKKVLGESHPDYASTVHNLAIVYEITGQNEKAEPLFIKALQLRTDQRGYILSLNSMSVFYMNVGEYEKADSLILLAIEKGRKVIGENHPDFGQILNNYAVLNLEKGHYDLAERYFLQSMELRRKLLGETHPEYAASFNNLSNLYRDLGQFKKAEPLMLQALEIWKKGIGENHPQYFQALNNLVDIYREFGYYEKSESILLNAIEIGKRILGEHHRGYARSINNLAILYRIMGRREKAEQFFLQAMKIRQSIAEDLPDYIESLVNISALYREMGKFEKAELFNLEAIEKGKGVLGEYHPIYAQSISNLAGLFKDIGKYEQAEKLLTEEREIVTKNAIDIFAILSEKEKENYLASKIKLNDNQNSFVYHYPNATSSFRSGLYDLQLLLKSFSLNSTKNMLSIISNSKDTIVQNRFSIWRMYKSILSKQYVLPRLKRRRDLKVLEEMTENLEKELIRVSASFKNQQNNISVKAKAVSGLLGENEVAIEFVKFRVQSKKPTDSIVYAAYILKRNDSVPDYIPLFEEMQLKKILDSAGHSSSAKISKLYRGTELKDRSAVSLGKDLYKLIWAPLEPYLKEIKKINYSPAGILYSIAFHALPADSATLLIDKYELHQYTSTKQVALKEKNPTRTPNNIALFGDPDFTMDSIQLLKARTIRRYDTSYSSSIYFPDTRGGETSIWPGLPGTAEEVKKINQLFITKKIGTKAYVQITASEENLKALSGNSPEVLHIATHGFFLAETARNKIENPLNSDNTYSLEDDPLLRSGIVLAGGNYAWSGKTPIEGVEDGIATAYEISQLNLSNTELVVLSACETALGDVKGSEGVFGLQRAFKMAGVKKMIVSLWQVPDKETAELMTAFYSYWLKGKTIEEAFAQAQADMRKKYPPFYWAAFVLVE